MQSGSRSGFAGWHPRQELRSWEFELPQWGCPGCPTMHGLFHAIPYAWEFLNLSLNCGTIVALVLTAPGTLPSCVILLVFMRHGLCPFGRHVLHTHSTSAVCQVPSPVLAAGRVSTGDSLGQSLRMPYPVFISKMPLGMHAVGMLRRLCRWSAMQ